MIDDETLDKIRGALPPTPFRTYDLALTLRMKERKLAFALSILKRLKEVTRDDVRVELARGYSTSRSFWRKTE